MVSPVNVQVRSRRTVAVSPSPLSTILVVPKSTINAEGDADPAIAAPENELTAITASNEDDQLGVGFQKACLLYTSPSPRDS